MTDSRHYSPGKAEGASVRRTGDSWTLVLLRELAHPPADVWRALTEPEHLRQWAPFDADQFALVAHPGSGS